MLGRRGTIYRRTGGMYVSKGSSKHCACIPPYIVHASLLILGMRPSLYCACIPPYDADLPPSVVT